MSESLHIPAELVSGQKAFITNKRLYIELEAERKSPGKAPKWERVGHKAGLMLDQLVFWSSKAGAVPDWIYKSHVDWYDETCLTRRESECSTKKLCEMGLVDTDLRHPPGHGAPTLHYRVNWQALQAAIDRLAAKRAAQEPAIAHYAQSTARNGKSIAHYAQSLTDSPIQTLPTDQQPEPPPSSPPTSTALMVIPQPTEAQEPPPAEAPPDAAERPRGRRTRKAEEHLAEAKAILEYLNSVTGHQWGSRNLDAALEYILPRVRGGATAEEGRLIIDWCHTVMGTRYPDWVENCLNPVTPFRRGNYENYRAQARTWEQQGRPIPQRAGNHDSLVRAETKAKMEQIIDAVHQEMAAWPEEDTSYDET